MSYYPKTWARDVATACALVRRENHTIPSETLDLMREELRVGPERRAALEEWADKIEWAYDLLRKRPQLLGKHWADIIREAYEGAPTYAELREVLPGTYYMDAPDGGSPSLLEQLRRMSEDATRWRYATFGCRLPKTESVGGLTAYEFAAGGVMYCDRTPSTRWYLKSDVDALFAKTSKAQHIPGNFTTHREAWRKALEHCLAAAEEGGQLDDVHYWQHELAAYDRAFTRLLDKPEPKDPAK